MPAESHIFIGISSTGVVDLRWALAFHQFMDRMPPGTTYAADWKYGVAETRERLVERALVDKSVTHIMFLDSDVMPPIDAGMALLHDDLPIVSGVYFNSLGTGINAWSGEVTVMAEQKADIIQVEKVGMGLCMIKREVFEAIHERPRFYFKVQDGNYLGEDFYFCRLAAKYGYRPHVDMRIKAGHLRTVVMQYNSEALI